MLVPRLDDVFDAFLTRSVPFLNRPYTLLTSRSQALKQIRLNLSYGGWGLRSYGDHLPAAVYSSVAEFLTWLQGRSPSLSSWLGTDLQSAPDMSVLGPQSILLRDFDWSCDVLQSRWGFSVCDRPAPSQSAVLSCELNTRQASRHLSASIPSLTGLFNWNADTPLPRQHNISHFISGQVWHSLHIAAPTDSRDFHRTKAVCRYEVPLVFSSSALSFHSYASSKTLKVTPRALMSLTCPHYLQNDDFKS